MFWYNVAIVFNANMVGFNLGFSICAVFPIKIQKNIRSGIKKNTTIDMIYSSLT